MLPEILKTHNYLRHHKWHYNAKWKDWDHDAWGGGKIRLPTMDAYHVQREWEEDHRIWEETERLRRKNRWHGFAKIKLTVGGDLELVHPHHWFGSKTPTGPRVFKVIHVPWPVQPDEVLALARKSEFFSVRNPLDIVEFHTIATPELWRA
jgi:hypothetical protein